MGSMPVQDAIKISDYVQFTPQRKMRIVCAGAGMSGIIMAYKMEHQYGLTKNGMCEFIAYEKNVS